jgi:hypothetical protein
MKEKFGCLLESSQDILYCRGNFFPCSLLIILSFQHSILCHIVYCLLLNYCRLLHHTLRPGSLLYEVMTSKHDLYVQAQMHLR